jgi:hypothetical protein
MMNATIQKLCCGLIFCTAALFSGSALAQIDYFEDFDDDSHKWTTLDFYTTNENVCIAGYAYRANPVNEAGVRVPVETVSPSIGVSNGELLTLKYNYKLLDHDEVLPYRAVDDEDWGTISLEYGPTINGPWTEIDYITPFDHLITDECTQRVVQFIPEEDTEMFLRFVTDAGTSLGANFYVYLDDVSAYQETLSVMPVISLDEVQAYPNPVTDYLILDYDGYITDVVIYNMQGQAVVVEDMDNDFKRLNMEGLTDGQYMVRVATDDTQIRTINVIKR